MQLITTMKSSPTIDRSEVSKPDALDIATMAVADKVRRHVSASDFAERLDALQAEANRLGCSFIQAEAGHSLRPALADCLAGALQFRPYSEQLAHRISRYGEIRAEKGSDDWYAHQQLQAVLDALAALGVHLQEGPHASALIAAEVKKPIGLVSEKRAQLIDECDQLLANQRTDKKPVTAKQAGTSEVSSDLASQEPVLVDTFEMQSWLTKALAPASTPGQIAFLDETKLALYLENARSKGGDRLSLVKHNVDRIVAAGHGMRQLGMLPLDWERLLDEFETQFPNFLPLSDLLKDHFALHSLGDRRVSWPVVLLVGEAGIGKTEAARWLAERLSLPFRVFDMASAQTGSPLSGSEAFWSNSRPGDLFELLAYQTVINPVVVLDELDKANAGDERFDPFCPLHTLLESRSARSFVDLSIRDFAIDASHINWIGTANSLDSIPTPILSRMTVLHIATPAADQLKQIAGSIYSRIRAGATWGQHFPDTLPAEILYVLANQSPRTLVRAMTRAFGAAARDGRCQLQVADLLLPASERHKGIGFLVN
jgi:ATP-dependent Lon protease